MRCVKRGIYTQKFFFCDDREGKYENERIALQRPISNLFTSFECCEVLDQYQGHFFEFLEDESGYIYLLIHSGSWVLADQVMKKYWMSMARKSYKRGWSVKDDIINGYFKVPVEGMKELFPEYYNDILSLYNFTIAYRDIIEQEISLIFYEIFRKKIPTKLESDYSHTKLQITEGNTVIHQRGVQYLKGDKKTRYIMCGTQSKPSLMFIIDNDDFFSHGIPENVEEADISCLDYTRRKVVKGELLCPIMTIK